MLIPLAWLGLSLPAPALPAVTGGVVLPVVPLVSLDTGATVSPGSPGAIPAVAAWADYVRLRHAAWGMPGVDVALGSSGIRAAARLGGGVVWTRSMSPADADPHDRPSPAAALGADLTWTRGAWGARLAERTWVTTATRLEPLETYALVRPELSLAAVYAW